MARVLAFPALPIRQSRYPLLYLNYSEDHFQCLARWSGPRLGSIVAVQRHPGKRK